MRKLPSLLSVALLLVPCAMFADEDKRNVMLNAESATVPRTINVGLPDSGNGAVVFVDGMKHAFGLPLGRFHWAGGNAYESLGTIDLMEAVIRCGEYSIVVDSRTRFVSENWTGAFTGATSTNGLIRFDGAVTGPLSKGWFLSAGAYINYDPTAVNAPSRPFVEQRQIYQASLSKLWQNASLNIAYRLSFSRDNIDDGYSVAPFIYNGDGSISPYGGFRLGRDCYMPADETARWMDLQTGQFKQGDISTMDSRRVHDLSLIYKRLTPSQWDLTAAFHLCYMAPSQTVKIQLSGIDDVTAAQGFTLPDGQPFAGKVQNRVALVYDTWTADPELLLEARKRIGRHNLDIGLSSVFCHQYESSSTFTFAHTVEASPLRLLKDGESTWNYNRNSTYFEALKMFSALFVFDDWQASDRLLVRSGLRFKPVYNNILAAPRLEGETKNTRVAGFNLADPSLAEIHRFRKGGIDYVASEHIAYSLTPGLTAVTEGFYSMTNKTSTYYRNATLPTLKPIGNALVRAGLTYGTPFMELAAVASYITSWNNAAAVSVTHKLDSGESDTIPWVAQYGIGTPGFTVDANFHKGGWGLHARATWQDPRYKNYRNEFTFSDGSTKVIDYTGKTVTGISRLMVEFDPSYKWSRYRVWASVRYYSRQYVSRTNLASFNGHFETFAGADFTVAKGHKISLNLVNMLGQSGAKGSIDSVDTIEDAALLKGLVIAGSYIRPFTVDLLYTYRF